MNMEKRRNLRLLVLKSRADGFNVRDFIWGGRLIGMCLFAGAVVLAVAVSLIL